MEGGGGWGRGLDVNKLGIENYFLNVKGATSRFAHLENFSLNFSSSSFAIRVNLRHAYPSSLLFGLFLPLWCLSTLANDYFSVLFYLKAILYDTKNDSKYCDVAPLTLALLVICKVQEEEQDFLAILHSSQLSFCPFTSFLPFLSPS